ncbi:EAL domain-containing protein [Halioxenophilus sp. WMMB6]|uniref:EAL domain-containing protein n=1 Tax=Halioxenophilus sp. WMMB6 TaxID=3073815 RepID=UPI00295E880C|nr:EAL domain-containing protein [Halioxenophilus sp. WMMB6]
MPSLPTYKQVVDSLELGVMLLDKSLCVKYLNDWLYLRSGKQPEQALNQPLAELFGELQNSRLLECCHDAVHANLPARLSNSFNPSPLPLYDPKYLGNDLYRLQQVITIRPLELDQDIFCELVVYDITTAVIKENWLKRVAANFRRQSQQKEVALEQLTRIIENTGDAILVFAKNEHIELANASATTLLGHSHEQLERLTLRELLPKERDEHSSTLYDRLMLALDSASERQANLHVPSVNTRLMNAEGRSIPVDIKFSISHADDDIKIILVIRDCSHLVETERNFLESENRFQTLAKIAPVGIFRTSDKGVVLYANETWMRMTGCHVSELHHLSWLDFLDKNDKDKITTGWHNVRSRKGGFKEEFKLRRALPSGQSIWVLGHLMAEHDSNDNISGFVGTFTDITQQRTNQEEIERLAYHDVLTGLSNRRHFHDNLTRQIKANSRSQEPFALLALDLNGFKAVNDTYGHDAGDRVLIAVANRLQHCLRESNLIARIGGDEFFVLIPKFDQLKDLMVVSRRIVEAMGAPIDLDGGQVTVTTSIGIALYPSDADSAEELIKCADMALYSAKSNHRDASVFFNQQMNRTAEASRALELDLQEAISNDQFHLYFQPLTLQEGQSQLYAESLVRWQHPQQGLLYPNHFISILDKSRFAGQFTQLVFTKICQFIRGCISTSAHTGSAKISVNLSANQLLANNFEVDITRLLHKHGIECEQLQLEVSEKTLNGCFVSILPVLIRLQRKGFAIILDDFSSAYLPLQRLTQLPLAAIKLDRSVVLDIDKNRQNQILVATIAEVCKSMDWQFIGKGVETPQQKLALTNLGCYRHQGFLYSKPLTMTEFARFVSSGSSVDINASKSNSSRLI